MKTHIVKEYYTQALFELLKKKPLQDISISDLVRKSGASRASFYRNYESKEQIIDEYLRKTFGECFSRHPISKENMRTQVENIFNEILAQREPLTILCRTGQLYRIDEIIHHDTISQIEQLNVMNNVYQPFFFSGAAASMIKAWIEFDFKESPSEMSDIFFRSLSGYMELE